MNITNFADMSPKNLHCFYFAPIQESTDFVYRGAYASIFGNVDKYFAPYIVRQNDGTIKKSHLRDAAPENNQGYKMVPQIMAGNAEDFLYLAKMLCDSGYEEINWNLGCPYPMATNKGLGAGLLPFPGKIKEILSDSLPKLSCRISVKLRSGLQSADEIFKVIPILNEFPLDELILHPRIAKQLYRGTSDRETFMRVNEISKHPLVYNGDIFTKDDFIQSDDLFKTTTSWMMGRGILMDPFLPAKLKQLPLPEKEKSVVLLKQFHEKIFLSYSKLLSGNSHLLTRMTKFWSYFCYSFPDPAKSFKRIKKAGSAAKYEAAISENFQRLINHEED
jgi:tRNA-dihydrouridine synthase B